MSARGIRVLVLCADIGEGHVTVARELAASLREREEVSAVELHTDLTVMGERFGRFMTRGFETHLEQIGWTYDLAYRLFVNPSLPRKFGQLALAAFGQRGLRRTIAAFGPDVIVTEYPLLSAALGELRGLGRLSIPVCSSVSDPAGLYYWAHPAIDVHLLSWPESLAEVDRIAGPGKARAVKPLVDRRFLTAPSKSEARITVGVPAAGPIVVVSGGGWGIGDLDGAVDVTLATRPDAMVVALAGRSEPAARQLRSRFDADPRVLVLAFTEQMPELLAAADLLIHTTGGTTALEARIVGCPLINYGTGLAHVRAHARAMSEQRLAEWATTRAALAGAIMRTLTKSPPVPLDVSHLPAAADVVLSVATGGSPGPFSNLA